MLSLAPDAASAKAGATLATGRKWTGLSGDGRALWGVCQGSGKEPYRTAVDLGDLATRCSCPSRKFPCKHALGLLLLLVGEPELFAADTPPAWVREWLTGRAQRAERADRSRAPDAAESDPERDQLRGEAREKRAAARATKIAGGLVELARWLEDLVQGGLAAAPSRPSAFWDAAAARLVDAQAPGAARMVRQCAAIVTSGGDWAERLVATLARLHLLAEAYPRLATLPPALQADVRSALGLTPTAEDLEALPGVADAWTVVGQAIAEEDRLRARRTWLVGRDGGRVALLLHFAHGTAPFAEAVPPVGGVLEATLTFHPGSAPSRASVRARSTPTSATAHFDDRPMPGHARLADATRDWAASVAANPWTERVLLLLSAVVPVRHADRWHVRDAAGDAVPVAPRFGDVWPLVALAGGHPVWLAGEWDGDVLLPLAAAGADAALTPLGLPVAGRTEAPA